MGEGNRTACDICKQTLTEADILCNGCREAITSLHQRQPELLESEVVERTLSNMEAGAAAAA